MTKRTGLLIGFLAVAVASRLLILGGPAWANFSPIPSMALFAGAYFNHRSQSISWTLLAVWFSNLILNNVLYTSYFPSFSWGIDPVHMFAFVLITFMGSYLIHNKLTVLNFLGANLGASVGFFILSNFAVWYGSQISYTKDLSGLMTCYAAGLPFLKNSLASQFIFSGLFFGSFELLKKRIPALN